jgi:hypothetical protein
MYSPPMGWLKDGIEIGLSAWRNISKDWLLSLFQSTVARARRWRVDHWYPLDEAIREFGDRELVRCSAEANRKCWQEATGAEVNQVELEEATERDEYLRERLLEDLRDRLTSGELIARGFREPLSQSAPYLTISRHEWRVIWLETPGHPGTRTHPAARRALALLMSG